VDLIFLYGHSLLLATAACYFPIEQNEKNKSERALKRFLFVFGDLLPLCSPVAFSTLHFLAHLCRFHNRCGVTLFGVRVSSCKKQPISAESLHAHIHTRIHTNRAKREIQLCVDLQTVASLMLKFFINTSACF